MSVRNQMCFHRAPHARDRITRLGLVHLLGGCMTDTREKVSQLHGYDPKAGELPRSKGNDTCTDPNADSRRGPHARDLKSRGLTDCSTFPWGTRDGHA
ncbi:hypothetical protein CRG98_006354 [Punica granatum]|uniref:Uncharacterized protein n=1 Tax=Punica granatum TaxID=22663 RepID=A0A2I0KXM7_PUNGR|nr:hypothetical protein CRG98_006354 [Punica granatum]